ncbi:MAG: hypothetical protein JXR63_09505 [Spirochaetales bacterium]|nr:hypothetical protein [Spirochaetales bacterium]
MKKILLFVICSISLLSCTSLGWISEEDRAYMDPVSSTSLAKVVSLEKMSAGDIYDGLKSNVKTFLKVTELVCDDESLIISGNASKVLSINSSWTEEVFFKYKIESRDGRFRFVMDEMFYVSQVYASNGEFSYDTGSTRKVYVSGTLGGFSLSLYRISMALRNEMFFEKLAQAVAGETPADTSW